MFLQLPPLTLRTENGALRICCSLAQSRIRCRTLSAWYCRDFVAVRLDSACFGSEYLGGGFADDNSVKKIKIVIKGKLDWNRKLNSHSCASVVRAFLHCHPDCRASGSFHCCRRCFHHCCGYHDCRDCCGIHHDFAAAVDDGCCCCSSDYWDVGSGFGSDNKKTNKNKILRNLMTNCWFLSLTTKQSSEMNNFCVFLLIIHVIALNFNVCKIYKAILFWKDMKFPPWTKRTFHKLRFVDQMTKCSEKWSMMCGNFQPFRVIFNQFFDVLLTDYSIHLSWKFY